MLDDGNIPADGRGKWIAPGFAVISFIIFVALLARGAGPFLHLAWLVLLVLPLLSFAIVYRFLVRQLAGGISCSLFESKNIVSWVIAAGLILYLFSGAVDTHGSFMASWLPGQDGDLYQSFSQSRAVVFCIVAAVLVPVLAFCRTSLGVIVIVFGVLIWLQVACFNEFWQATCGYALSGGSHSCFMYRLWLFAESFPRITCYDPFWNGGVESLSFLSGGIVPLGMIALPLWKLFPLDLIYTPMLALAFMIFVPLVAGVAARIAGGGWVATGCAATMALGVSRYYFERLLSAGDVGACFAVSFSVLVAACLYRVIWLKGLENRTGILLALALVMFIAWPPAILMALAFVPAVVASARRWSFRKITFILLCLLSASAICLPFVVGLMGGGGLFDILRSAPSGARWSAGVAEGWDCLIDQFRLANPCLLFLGMLGTWFLPQKGVRILFGGIILGLCLLGGWGNMNGQLLIAIQSALFVSLVPAALWIEQWFENKSPSMILLRALVLSLLLVCGLSIAGFYGNKESVFYDVMDRDARHFIDWINKNAPTGGRILFAESTASGITCLPAYTGREMMASDSVVDGDYLSGLKPGRESEFVTLMDIHNVIWIVTGHDGWREFLRRQPDQYEMIKDFSDRSVFQIKRRMGQFLKGNGHVKAQINKLVVTVDDPLETVVLKYNWEDGLFVETPSEVRPFEAGQGRRLIAVSPHGKTTIRVKFKKLL